MASGCDFRLKVKSRRHFLPGLYFLLTLQDFPLVYYSQSSQSNKRFFRFFLEPAAGSLYLILSDVVGFDNSHYRPAPSQT